MANVVRRSRVGGIETKVEFLQDTIVEKARQLAKKSAFEIGLFVAGQAKDLAPVGETGNLRSSIQVAAGDGRRDGGGTGEKIEKPEDVFEVYVGSPLEYATYVEYGTGIYVPAGRKTPWSYQDSNGKWHYTMGMPAQPFLRPALDIAKGKAPDILEQEGKKEFAGYLQ